MCPTGPSSDSLLSDPLLTAHKSIRECVRALQDLGDSNRVRTALLCLEETLPPHFAYEERPGGFIERLEATNEQAGGRLRQDHLEILALLNRLTGAEELDLAAVRELADRVARHEEMENRLAIAPLSDDDAQKWRGYA